MVEVRATILHVIFFESIKVLFTVATSKVNAELCNAVSKLTVPELTVR